MNAEKDHPHQATTHSIIGAAIEVMNTLGHRFHEKPHERALVVELQQRGLSVQQQPAYELTDKRTAIGALIPDLVVADAVIMDTKVVERIADRERGQIINHLKAAGLTVGLLINFSRPKLDWAKIILQDRAA